MRAAIIGAGPSGFFVAGEILRRCPGCEVHLFERGIAPYGLVRYGVAPDHGLTRRTITIFNQIADHPRFYYHGQVEIGRDITLDALHESFHAVIACVGAEQPARPDVPGARLPGAVDALDIARWVNGDAEAFDAGQLAGVESALIIGNGNVALDAARMLMRHAADWVSADIAPYALEALMHHRVRRIQIVGRRGPHEAAFTEAELTEVVHMPDWSVHHREPLPFNVTAEKPPFPSTLAFRFHLRLECLLGGDRVVGARFTNTQNGETVEAPAQLVVFATGHRGVPLGDLPFDPHRGIIPNDHGAVLDAPGFYVCGWIKRGAKGLIGHNKKDAVDTVGRLLEDRDVLAARQIDPVDWRAVLLAQGLRPVSWPEWRALEAREQQRGAAVGRPRIPLPRDEMISWLNARTP
ncbi:MAG TPA: hypothetical protein PKE26_10095 [Kiritimatiellia bacterium]|nr:hypothetical protein [Kiritimatiellia bacterium]HMO99448.1 hypothetical protein [Kiritimatiellia bacterium]HMP97264.1 hypothetical protein [Kiritimatiellia bacterium]